MQSKIKKKENFEEKKKEKKEKNKYLLKSCFSKKIL